MISLIFSQECGMKTLSAVRRTAWSVSLNSKGGFLMSSSIRPDLAIMIEFGTWELPFLMIFFCASDDAGEVSWFI